MGMSRILLRRADAELPWNQGHAGFVVLVTVRGFGVKWMVGQTRPGQSQPHQQPEAKAGKR
jgi:hypothetical protein